MKVNRLAVLILAGIAGCSKPVPFPDSVSEWGRYKHRNPDYAISYPADFGVIEDDNQSAFDYQNHRIVLIRYVTEEEGRHRGLWFGHEVSDERTIGNHTFKIYTYSHYDGPFGSRTIACVLPLNDRYLGIEFRTDEDLNRAQLHMLESLKLGQ